MITAEKKSKKRKRPAYEQGVYLRKGQYGHLSVSGNSL